MGRASDKVDYNEGNQAVLPISQNIARLSINPESYSKPLLENSNEW